MSITVFEIWRYVLLYGIFTVVLFTGIAGSAFAQGKVHGIIADESRNPIADVNVLLLNAGDSSLVKGVVTSASGIFDFENIRKGIYFIMYTHTGKKPDYSSAFEILTYEIRNLGMLIIQPDTVNLKEVTVTAIRPVFEQKIDRLVINVQNSITSAGNTALEVLERSPGVMVNHQNNSISMNGKDGVMIMLNGKISRMPIEAAVQMLAGMSSSNIDRIELISTPPAYLEAEGNAGYINIILKENPDVGTNGNFSVNAGYGQGIIFGTSLNFNHRKNKVNLYGDISLSRIKTTPFVWFKRVISNSGVITESYQNTDRESVVFNVNGRVGLDYNISRRTVAGVLFSGYTNRYSHDALNSNFIKVNNRIDTSIRIFNTESNHWKSVSGNVYVQHDFGEGEKISLNADYIHYSNNQPVDYSNSYFDGNGNLLFIIDTRSGKATPIDIIVGSIDYSRAVSKSINMQTGLKVTGSTFKNDVYFETLEQGNWIKDVEESARYTLDEKYGAVYASADVSLNDNTTIKGGLRYEYITSNLSSEKKENIVDRNYGNLFPTFFLSHKINKDHSLNFSFNKRITRPTFNALAPFTYRIDPNTLITGNPSLQPAFSNMIKADYLFKKYIFSLSYTKENNAITGFQPQTDTITNRTILAPQNLVNQKIITLMVSLPVQISEWWNLHLNVTGLYQTVNALYKKEPVRLKQGNLNINGTNKFILPKNWSLEISGFYTTKTANGIAITRPFGSLDLGVRKSLKNNKGTIAISGNNILRTLIFRPYTNLPDQNLVTEGSLRFFGRSIKLTYSYIFGNEKMKLAQARKTGAEEEKARVQSQ